jgi:hypothetical protein
MELEDCGWRMKQCSSATVGSIALDIWTTGATTDYIDPLTHDVRVVILRLRAHNWTPESTHPRNLKDVFPGMNTHDRE